MGLLTMNNIMFVLSIILHDHPTTKSNFARDNANEIAELCSRGYITVIGVGGYAGTSWDITDSGIRLLLKLRGKK